jgi:hypothetical protein
VVCSYTERIGDAPAPPAPTAETHGPVVEEEEQPVG